MIGVFPTDYRYSATEAMLKSFILEKIPELFNDKRKDLYEKSKFKNWPKFLNQDGREDWKRKNKNKNKNYNSNSVIIVLASSTPPHHLNNKQE